MDEPKKYDHKNSLLLLWGCALILSLLLVALSFPKIVAGLAPAFELLTGKALTSRSVAVQWGFVSVMFALAWGILFGLFWRLRAVRLPSGCWFIVGGGTVLVILGMILHICLQIPLMRDDYWEIADAIQQGFPGFIAFQYIHATGRFTSLLIKSFYNFVNPLALIHGALFLIQLLLLLSFWLVFRSLNKPCARKSILPDGARALAFAAVGMSGVVFMASNIWEVYFWGAGGLIYGIGIALNCLTFALLLSGVLQPSRRRGFWIAGGVTGVLACGCSQLSTISMMVFSMVGWLYCLLYRRHQRASFAFLVLIWCFGCISLLAPGNFNMAAQYGIGQSETRQGVPISSLFTPETLRAIGTGIQGIVVHCYARIEYLLLFSLLFLLIGTFFRLEKAWDRVIYGSIGALLLAAIASISINAMLGYTPPRVMAVPLTWIFLATAQLCFLIGARIPRANRVVWSGLRLTLLSLTVFVVWFVFYTGNIGALTTLKKGWDARDHALWAAQPGNGATLTCSLPLPGTGFSDISDDPTAETNLVAAKYYQLEAIAAPAFCAGFADSE